MMQQQESNSRNCNSTTTTTTNMTHNNNYSSVGCVIAESWHPHVYGKPPKHPTPHFIADILGLKDNHLNSSSTLSSSSKKFSKTSATSTSSTSTSSTSSNSCTLMSSHSHVPTGKSHKQVIIN